MRCIYFGIQFFLLVAYVCEVDSYVYTVYLCELYLQGCPHMDTAILLHVHLHTYVMVTMVTDKLKQ